MKRLAFTAVVCLMVGGCGMPEGPQAGPAERAPVWALDPGMPGPNQPPAGRSLFDHAIASDQTSNRLPASFDALVRQIERRLGCTAPCSHQVLIPLGRALQRTAAAPDFFASPRVVVAFTGEGSGKPFAKDRLYLGFQPRAGVIEVISYNDVAARFEFQLVKDFRPGATPRVTYAERTLCVACHQNHGPIFSRQVWDETNANPRIAAALSGGSPVSHRVPVEVPNAIDDATDRANGIGVTQRLWAEACNAECRRLALAAAIQHHLTGRFDREPFARALEQGFRSRWPDGLAIPNPDVPNRDPFAFHGGPSDTGASHVPAALEALVPRAPLEIWRPDDFELAYRMATGLAELFSNADFSAIERRLGRNSDVLRDALRTIVLPSQRVDRGAILQAIGAQHLEVGHEVALPALLQDPAPVSARVPSKAVPFRKPCGSCPTTDASTPPNFLAGDATRVEASLTHCAPRLFVRLAQWDLPPATRAKVPMPPPQASRAGHPWTQDKAAPSILSLRNAVAGWLREETGVEPDLEQMLAHGYENLRPCLQPGA